MIGAFRRGGGRRSGLGLALLALLVLALVPPGFMPGARTSELGVPLVICTGQGGMVVGEFPGDRQPGPVDEGHKPVCIFAGLAAAPPPPPIPAPTAPEPAPTAEASPGPARALAPGRGLTAPPPPARGPPARFV